MLTCLYVTWVILTLMTFYDLNIISAHLKLHWYEFVPSLHKIVDLPLMYCALLYLVKILTCFYPGQDPQEWLFVQLVSALVLIYTRYLIFCLATFLNFEKVIFLLFLVKNISLNKWNNEEHKAPIGDYRKYFQWETKTD